MSDYDLTDLRVKFLATTLERLEKLTNGFLELEHSPDNLALADDIMRQIHTLKGEAALVELVETSELAHWVEELLLLARQRKFRAVDDLGDLILEGFDGIALLAEQEASDSESELRFDLPAYVEKAGQAIDRIKDGSASPVAPKSESAAASPSRDRSQPSPASTSDPDPGTGETREREEGASIRVDPKRIDQLTELVAEMVVDQGGWLRLLRGFKELTKAWRTEHGAAERQLTALRDGALGEVDASRSELEKLRHFYAGELELLSRADGLLKESRELAFANRLRLQDLQERITRLRLLPIKSLFARYPRAVRDLASKQGKRIQVVVRDDDVSVDKQVLDRLKEPLLHLVRNCVDHGIELPQERSAMGKKELATITLRSRQHGSQVEVLIVDDGRGIDSQLVRAAAERRGIPVAEDLDERALVALAFEPGLSTRGDADELSGRGVGLDVVRKTVESLGGKVEIQSILGHGTTVRLLVPFTIATLSAIVVEADGLTFAFPAEFVSVLTEVERDQLVDVAGGVAIRLAEDLVPARDLLAVLGWQRSNGPSWRRKPLVVLGHQDRPVGLLVDKIRGELDVVQRPIGEFLEAIRIVSGTAVLEGGKVALVINVPELSHSKAETATASPAGTTDRARREAPRQVLIVDDSEISRDIVAGIVRGQGYTVREAVNGQDALDKVDSSLPDLIITDLEMPVMNGFDLLRQIRSLPEARDLPVIVLTNLGSAADKKKAVELGASAYLTKSSFREADTLKTVDRFLAR